MNDVFSYIIDGVSFKLGEKTDISFLNNFGRVDSVYYENDSGNLSAVVESDNKYFIKIAGLKTLYTQIPKNTAVENLRKAWEIYESIQHPCIIKPINFYEKDTLAVMTFPYVEGECLFDHWNFDYYEKNNIKSPLQRFLLFGIDKKMRLAYSLMEFYSLVNEAGYLAVDFYEGSILYNFRNDNYYFCDLDFFTPFPCNSSVETHWGPERFLAPEEKSFGIQLDERTDVFHLGVFIRIIFTDEKSGVWQLSKEKERIVQKAINPIADNRFSCIREFEREWRASK